LPQVERVLKLDPSVMTTVISWYSGWMFFFMGRVLGLAEGRGL
jgi:hypothetical protein